MGERRRSPRQKSFLRGCIYFDKRRSAFDCLIRDISDQGARIIFSDMVSVPDTIELYIPQKEQTLRAHVEWRRGAEIGVAFADAMGDESASNSQHLAGRIARLETEVASLRKALKKLQAEVAGGDSLDAA